MTWPIKWPAAVNTDALDPNIRRLCELYATACMSALTLHRVGGNPISIMPDARDRVAGHYSWFRTLEDGPLVGRFLPGTVQPSMEDLQNLHATRKTEAVLLPGPVGEVTRVLINQEELPASTYRVEDGRYLVRLDGGRWPSTTGNNFVVTYLNSYKVDDMGAHAAGVMAAEWLKLITGDKKCRLPSSATNVTRQGITIEVAAGMFPGNVTGLPEIDAYLMLFNPHSLRTAPRVYSPDLPQHRQVGHA